MTPHPRLIAIGGGGFTHETDPDLENFLLAQWPTARPRIGFVGTASRDDPAKIARFHARFTTVCASHTHLPMAADAAHAQAWLDDLDIVYVGGGNTLHLVAHWREQGIDQVMKAAALRGVLMAGVSAGANVWFDHALSDSAGTGLQPCRGIGLFAGSCCPHYSSEPQRPPAFVACIAGGALPDGVAIDDGVAVLVDGQGVMRAFSAREGGRAYKVRRSGDAAVWAPLPQAITP
ncbi:MAG: peptidase E [Rhodoferax sp.]|nr:peptidase E [Rhodoferax sp.]